jgi:hypothetical protein
MEGSIFDAYSHRLAVHHSNAVAIDISLGVFECGGVVRGYKCICSPKMPVRPDDEARYSPASLVSFTSLAAASARLSAAI